MKLRKKMNNKGFSLVELIVVIAIMAVLIGLLAPQFIRYIDRSKYSSDIKNGQEIATIVQSLLADGKLKGGITTTTATGSTTVPTEELFDTGNNAFKAAVDNKLITDVPTSKVDSTKKFFVTYDAAGEVKVYVGAKGDAGTGAFDKTNANEVYPKLGKTYSDGSGRTTP